MEPPKTIQEIAAFLRKLPTVGSRSAQRLAYACLTLPREDLEAFVSVLSEALESIRPCPECQLLIDTESCPICSDPKRDETRIMAVVSSRDVLAIEQSESYDGKYFVLNGTVSPAEHRTPESTGVERLVRGAKEKHLKEVICCTGSDIEGETTALLIARMLKGTGIRVTRPASGLPTGAVIEYADPLTIGRALKGRTDISED